MSKVTSVVAWVLAGQFRGSTEDLAELLLAMATLEPRLETSLDRLSFWLVRGLSRLTLGGSPVHFPAAKQITNPRESFSCNIQARQISAISIDFAGWCSVNDGAFSPSTCSLVLDGCWQCSPLPGSPSCRFLVTISRTVSVHSLFCN